MADTPETMPQRWTPEFLAQDHSQPIIISAILFIILDTLLLILRGAARRLQKLGWSWDDLLISCSWLMNVGLCICLLLSVANGSGRHIEWLSLHPDLARNRGLIDLYVEPCIYCAAVVFPRLAVLALYLKIFTNKISRGICWAVGGIMIAQNIAVIFAVIFQCHPREKVWNPAVPGSCDQVELLFIWGTFPNFVLDAIILMLPLPMIWHLHARAPVKAGIMITFLIGSIGIITSIIRWSAFFTDQFVFGDQSWADNPLTIYLACEPTVYHICACLLTLRPLLRRLTETKAASTLYRWLMSISSRTNRTYDSLGERGKTPGQDSGKPSINDPAYVDRDSPLKGSGGKSLTRQYISPFHVSSYNSSARAENGEAVEMNHIHESQIHVQTEFSVERT